MFCETEGDNVGDGKREASTNPAQSETPSTLGNSMRENRETPLVTGSSTPDRLEKAISHTSSMHAIGESDEQVVPAKRSNKVEQSAAESVEGSCSTKGNTDEAHRCRTQGREHVSQGLGGVREAARRDKKQRFTATESTVASMAAGVTASRKALATACSITHSADIETVSAASVDEVF